MNEKLKLSELNDFKAHVNYFYNYYVLGGKKFELEVLRGVINNMRRVFWNDILTHPFIDDGDINDMGLKLSKINALFINAKNQLLEEVAPLAFFPS